MYAVCVTFRIHPGKIAEFLPLMMENARVSRSEEPGCQQFDVCRDGDEVFLYEIYDDRAAFDFHLASAHFKSFDTVSAEMVADKQVHLYAEVLR